MKIKNFLSIHMNSAIKAGLTAVMAIFLAAPVQGATLFQEDFSSATLGPNLIILEGAVATGAATAAFPPGPTSIVGTRDVDYHAIGFIAEITVIENLKEAYLGLGRGATTPDPGDNFGNPASGPVVFIRHITNFGGSDINNLTLTTNDENKGGLGGGAELVNQDGVGPGFGPYTLRLRYAAGIAQFFVNNVQFGPDVDVSSYDFTGQGHVFFGGQNVRFDNLRIQSSDSPVGHWSLDDAAGSTSAADSSGNGNQGMCGGMLPIGDAFGQTRTEKIDCPTFGAAGRVGTSADFDGATEALLVNNTIPNSFTVTAWINTTGNGGGSDAAFTGNGIIWSDVAGSAADMIPMALVQDRLAFGTGGNSTVSYDTLTSTVSINTGQWVCAAVTRDMTTGAKQLYINGKLDATNSAGGLSPLNANSVIAFGSNPLDNRYFDGQIDDIYFYDRVLSASEIEAHCLPRDSDGDGVSDDDDLCSDTPLGDSVDASGCSDAQVDGDGDGVSNNDDLCSDTALGDPVDASGCSDAQVDSDGDGFCDPGTPSDGPSICTGSDNCPTVPNADQADSNGDGIGDACDDPVAPVGPVGPVADFVTRFYQTILGRAPDNNGLNGWVDGLLNGQVAACDIASGFVFSPEFVSRNASDEEYLDVLYRAFFNREPDIVGRNGWLNELKSGLPRREVLDGFLSSQEFATLAESFGIIPCGQPDAGARSLTAFVTRFYRLVLGRDPDSGGLKGWVDGLLNGQFTGCDIASGFVFSPEFINRNTSDEAYVDILYEAFFNREADTPGRNGWLNVLQSGGSRREVLDGFLSSQEFATLAESFGITACAEGSV